MVKVDMATVQLSQIALCGAMYMLLEQLTEHGCQVDSYFIQLKSVADW